MSAKRAARAGVGHSPSRTPPPQSAAEFHGSPSTPRAATKRAAKKREKTPEPLAVQTIRVTIQSVAASNPMSQGAKVYCSCNVPGKKRLRFKTPSVEPVMHFTSATWHHSHDFPDFDPHDTLQVNVLAEDPDGDDLIGRGSLDPHQFLVDGFEGNVELQSGGETTGTVSLKVSVGSLPPISKSATAARTARSATPGRHSAGESLPIKVTIVCIDKTALGSSVETDAFRQQHLSGWSGDGSVKMPTSSQAFDSYCAVSVPGKKRMRFKTPMVSGSTGPAWGHSHEFLDFTTGDSLQFSLFIHDPSGDELVGRTTLEPSQLLPNGFEGKLGLENAGQPVKTSITVKVELATSSADTSRQETGTPASKSAKSRSPTSKRTKPATQSDDVPDLALTTSATPIGLRITLVGAKGVKTANGKGEPNSYCVCNVPGKKRFRFKTPKAAGEKPAWNHTEEFHDASSSDSLNFTVFTQNAGGDDLVGTVSLSPNEFVLNGFEGKLGLENAGETIKTSLALKIEVIANDGTHATTRGAAKKQVASGATNHDMSNINRNEPVSIRVTIMSAKDLEKPDGVGNPDSYCSCHVPGKKNMRFKTPVVVDKNNPFWRFKYDFLEFAPADNLKFTVFHNVSDFTGDIMLGSAELNAVQFIKNGFDGRLSLENPERSTWASVNVKVDILGARPIRVTIVKVTGLRKPKDGLGTFCICKVPGKAGGKFRTSSVHTTDPEWKHSHDFSDLEAHDSLEIKVFEESPDGDNLLGRTALEADQFFLEGFEGPLKLEGNVAAAFNANIFVRVQMIKESEVRHQGILTGTDEQKLHTIFKRCDVNGSGYLNKKELMKVCHELPEIAGFFGLPRQLRKEDGSSQVLEALFQELDMDGNREVSWEELRMFWRATKERVHVYFIVTFKELSYNEIHADANVFTAFHRIVKDIIATEAEVAPDDILISLSHGSVIAHITIRPPRSLKAGDSVTKLNSSASLSQRLRESISAIPGIASMCTGSLVVNIGTAQLQAAAAIDISPEASLDAGAAAAFDSTIDASLQHGGNVSPNRPPRKQDMSNGGLFELYVSSGVKALGLRPNAPPPGRVLIAKVEDHSWAAEAGIIEGTEIVAIDQEDVQLLSTDAFIRGMQKRPMELTVLVPPSSVTKTSGSPKFPVQARQTEELDYALGWDPTIKKNPKPMHAAADPEAEFDQWYPDIHEQRERLKELVRVVDRARVDTLELRERKAHHAAEVARLEQLVALGDDPTYCRNCDLRMLNLQILLRAMGRVALVVFSDFAYGVGDYEILAESAEALNNAAYLDTQIAELAAYVSQSLSQIPTGPPQQKPRTLGEVWPAARFQGE